MPETIAAERPFAERTEERTAGPGRLLLLPTPVRQVVSFRGSFYTYPGFAAGEELLQALTVRLLNKGTRHRDRFAIAEMLENRGATLRFHSQGLRVGFSGRALREDVGDVLEVVAEQLQEPLFDPVEFEKARAQEAASLQRSMESTGEQAAAALSRLLYSPAHPNYAPAPQEGLAQLQAFTPEAVRDYHTTHFGSNGLILALVGDLDVATTHQAVEARFGSWNGHEAPPRFDEAASPEAPGQTSVPMPDKGNADVRMGHRLDVRRQDDDYLPLYVANYVLGGNFSARLMTVIRDEMGLTYGISSRLSGIAREYSGHWQVGVTLSRENVERGIEATREEVRRFAHEGILEDELRDKQTTITGAFKVGLATTGGLAASLLAYAERGFDVGYLDRFPSDVEALSLEEVNAAIERHFKPERFGIAVAGATEQ